MINNELETCSNSEEKAAKSEEKIPHTPSSLLSESKTSIKSNACQPSNLETIPEISVLSEGDSESKSKKPNSSRHSTVIFRNRNDSIRHITDKVLSISNDIFRSIENAHELIDLKHSNFSAATQTAAAHAALSHQNPMYDYANQYAINPESLSKEMGETPPENKTGSKLSRNFDSQSEKVPDKSGKVARPIDELNIVDACTERRANFENNFNKLNKKAKSDEIDFRTRRRFIFKNGSKKSIPDDIHISILEVFIYLWGVIAFFADLISDVILSIDYFHSSRFWLAIMTLMFVIVPNFTLSLFSLSWYIDKYESEKKLQEEKKKQLSNPNIVESHLPDTTCGSITFWIMTVLFVVFQLDLVWKYIQGFIYTLKVNHETKKKFWMFYDNLSCYIINVKIKIIFISSIEVITLSIDLLLNLIE
ncbi:XK-related 6 [Brachionus plicatilis]|uniref:XK-related protein n=1 Tax=Brachionus plicatilis TaxID=10195 RepID=A0A3M7Q2R1_BRAPC|nr:XK-related 6 [Brachionus plicatilis]